MDDTAAIKKLADEYEMLIGVDYGAITPVGMLALAMLVGRELAHWTINKKQNVFDSCDAVSTVICSEALRTLNKRT